MEMDACHAYVPLDRPEIGFHPEGPLTASAEACLLYGMAIGAQVSEEA